MKRKLLMFLSLLLIGIGSLAAQTQVQGTVVDELGEPVIGATIQIQGTSQGTVTDFDGNFNLDAPAGGILEVSYVGYISQEVPVSAIVNIVLQPDTQLLDEVMVVAYGTARKESFTGSAQVILSDKIENRMVADVTKALDGMAAGVQSTSGSGQPGAGAAVRIRGHGSLSATNTPLYVVDGVPYDGEINAINPNDIESMTIIKDASAGALYGARGANGVVMITTKRGKEGAVSVNFKANWGVSSRAIPRYETLDAYEWTENVYYMYKHRMITNNGIAPSEAGPAALQEMATGATRIFGNNLRYNPFNRPVLDLFDHTTGRIHEGTSLRWDEDWLDQATASNPLRQEYQMTVSGGTTRTNYMFSLGYLEEQGLVKLTDFQRYSGRANIDTEVKEWFKTGINLNLAANSTNSTALGTDQASSSAFSNVFYSAMKMPPIYPMYLKDENGQTVYNAEGVAEYDWGNDRPSGATPGWNPLANLEQDKYLRTTDNLSGRTYMEFGGLEEGPLQGLKLAVNFGFDYALGKNMTYYNPDFGNAVSTSGRLGISDRRTFSYTLNQLLSWNRRLDRHHFDILAGHELYKYNYKYLYAEKTGFPFAGLYELNAATTIADAQSYTDDYVIDSYLSRLNYDFDDKYYLSASFRRDGTSRFFKDVRWGNFWSLGGSWRISEEPFMYDYDWLNNLTLKASYGVQGNDAIGSYYAWQALYSLNPNQSQPGAVVSSLENTNLRWEKNENFNTGIEARIFDKLSISAEYYSRYTRDMLMDYPMALSTGFDSYSQNVGNMKNSGFEFTLSMDVIRNSRFSWNSTLIGSTVKNRVLNLADKPEIISGNYIIREGETLNSFYLAESAGVDPATGNKLYWVWDEDENGVAGEKYITSSYQRAQQSRSIAGSRIPNLYGSWSNSLSYRSLDLSVMTTYSIGGKMLDGVYNGLLYNSYVGEAAHIDRRKSWQQPGDITSIPRIDVGGAFTTTRTDDELIDASYFAIKNITLGYSLPSRWINTIGIESLRATLTADNIYIFTAMKGMDPQYNFSGGTGYTYTPSRTLSLGLDFRF